MFPQGISVQYVTLDREVSRTNLCETSFRTKERLGWACRESNVSCRKLLKLSNTDGYQKRLQ